MLNGEWRGRDNYFGWLCQCDRPCSWCYDNFRFFNYRRFGQPLILKVERWYGYTMDSGRSLIILSSFLLHWFDRWAEVWDNVLGILELLLQV